MNNSTLDLSQLALDRSANGKSKRRSKLVSRYVVPVAILAGFAGLIIYAAREQWMPRLDVTTIPVIVQRGQTQVTGSVLFQAAGWIEPSPTLINVAGLTSGMIDELLVVEGQHVKKGDPIARLNTQDVEFALKHAQTVLGISEGELQQADAELVAARSRLDNPVHLEILIADANSELANTSTELAKLPYLIVSNESQLEFARTNLQRKRAAGEAIPEAILLKAESEFVVAESGLRELQKREANLKSEVNALQAKLDAIKSQRDLLVNETREFQIAQGRFHSATAQRDQAKLRCEQTQLALDRTVIRAPISGCILRLVATPGMQLTAAADGSGQNQGTVAEMYDPARLQVRADVRLENVPLVQAGQLVEIETASSRQVIVGHVLQANSSANVQKNTLEVKVLLIDPPRTVRPEMLVTATFLAPENTDKNEEEEQTVLRCFVPRSLIQNDDDGSSVWIVDDQRRAQRRSVKVGKATNGSLIEISEGLNPADKLIASNTATLRENAAVRITGEEPSTGVDDVVHAPADSNE